MTMYGLLSFDTLRWMHLREMSCLLIVVLRDGVVGIGSETGVGILGVFGQVGSGT